MDRPIRDLFHGFSVTTYENDTPDGKEYETIVYFERNEKTIQFEAITGDKDKAIAYHKKLCESLRPLNLKWWG